MKIRKTYLLVIILSLTAYAVNARASMLLDRIVAVVNKDVITWSELYKSMEFDAVGEIKTMSEADRKRVFRENESYYIETMIDKKLQIQAAKSLDIDASKEEVAEAVGSVKKKYNMSDKAFEESLKKEGFTFDGYRKRIAEQIILSKVVGQQVRSKIVISEQELNEYMEKNKDASYRIRLILLKKTDKGPDFNALEAKANEIYDRLMKGDDFMLLARQFSEDPSARSAGDLGSIKKEHLSSQFIDVLSTMNVGDISRPFRTDRGIHIIRLEDKMDTSNMGEMREAMKKRLFEKQFNEAYKSWVRGLRDRAYIEVKL